MLVGQRRMHTTPLLRSHRMQLPSESLPVGPSLHHEATLSAPRAVMREAKEGKRLRPPVTARLTKFGREPAEFDEARFIVVERQAKRGEALPKGNDHFPRVRLVLEAHHEVVSITHDDDSPVRMPLPPLMDPQVEHVVQENVCEQRTNARTLRRTFDGVGPHVPIERAGPQPSADEPEDSGVGDPMCKHPQQPLVVDRVEEATDVCVKHPVHVLRHERRVQRP